MECGNGNRFARGGLGAGRTFAGWVREYFVYAGWEWECILLPVQVSSLHT